MTFCGKRGAQDDIGEEINRERYVLVEHLDVVARVLLGSEGVELTADGVNRLRDVFGGAGVGPLEQHVLDEVRDAAALVALVARAAHQPHADGHRPHVRHRFGNEPETVVENVAYNHALGRLLRHWWGLRVTGRRAGRHWPA
jgi:hypothetical protein